MSPVLTLYRVLANLAEPLAPALLRSRVRRGKEDPARLGERLGRPSVARPEGALAWLHGASVGESLSLLPLVERLRAARPDLSILVTSGTTTSAELMARRLPPGAIHQYAPIDTPGASARFLNAWRPDLVVFVESEFWPNLLHGAQARGARLAALSARLGAGSARNWRRAPKAARTLLGGFDLMLPQDDEAAARLSRLGGRDDGRLNLKLVGDPLPCDAHLLARTRAAIGPRPMLLAASTHPGEEAIALDAFRSLADADAARAPLLVLVPRHPVRGPEVAALAQAMGLEVALRSHNGASSAAARVWIADTLGELGLWFRLAGSALVGGSLVAGIGGHNPLEPARLACPIIAGPHIANWASVYQTLQAAGGLAQAVDAASLAGAWRADLDAPQAAFARAERALTAAHAGDADLDRAVERLIALIR
jgi:3-deoxy-D-manno-octulosonic-acid transferase